MQLLSFVEYERLSEAERVRRIAAILAPAIRRYYRRQALKETKAAAQQTSVGKPLLEDETEKLIVDHIVRVGAASPADLCLALQRPRRNIFRRLARLKTVGIVFASGAGRSTCYLLKDSHA